jgi:hypothetical protein
VHVATRVNATINRLQKTRTEIAPPQSTSHLREERDAHVAAKRKAANETLRAQRKAEEKLAKARKDEKERGEREWEDLIGEDRVLTEGRSNQEGGFDEDDFM